MKTIKLLLLLSPIVTLYSCGHDNFKPKTLTEEYVGGVVYEVSDYNNELTIKLDGEMITIWLYDLDYNGYKLGDTIK